MAAFDRTGVPIRPGYLVEIDLGTLGSGISVVQGIEYHAPVWGFRTRHEGVIFAALAAEVLTPTCEPPADDREGEAYG